MHFITTPFLCAASKHRPCTYITTPFSYYKYIHTHDRILFAGCKWARLGGVCQWSIELEIHATGDTWWSGCVAIWGCGYMSVLLSKSECVISEYVAIWVCGYWCVTSKCVAIWVCGSLGMWLSGNVAIWCVYIWCVALWCVALWCVWLSGCGYLSVWLSGCVAIWA